MKELNVVEASLVTQLNIERQHRKELNDQLNELILQRSSQVSE